MRRALYDETIDGTEDFDGPMVLAGYMHRASLVVTVSDWSGLDGVVALQASNEAPASVLSPREVSESSWADIQGAAIEINDGNLNASGATTLAFGVDLAYRFVRVVYRRTAGNGTIAFALELKGES